jgi:phage tail sheath gpL-like
MRMIDGVAITSAAGTQGTLGTLGDTRNSPHSSIVAQPGRTPSRRRASGRPPWPASWLYGQQSTRAALPDAAVAGVKAPAEADRFTLNERNLLLYDGISTVEGRRGRRRFSWSV